MQLPMPWSLGIIFPHRGTIAVAFVFTSLTPHHCVSSKVRFRFKETERIEVSFLHLYPFLSILQQRQQFKRDALANSFEAYTWKRRVSKKAYLVCRQQKLVLTAMVGVEPQQVGEEGQNAEGDDGKWWRPRRSAATAFGCLHALPQVEPRWGSYHSAALLIASACAVLRRRGCSLQSAQCVGKVCTAAPADRLLDGSSKRLYCLKMTDHIMQDEENSVGQKWIKRSTGSWWTNTTTAFSGCVN